MRLLVASALLCAVGAGAENDPTLKPFQDRLGAYLKLRKSAAAGAPALKKNATPEEIQARGRALAIAIQKARANAQPGDIFAADVKPVISGILKDAMKGKENKEVRASIKEGNPKHELAKGEVAPVIAVNGVYPTNAPLSTVPPSLLERLPKLPKELEYRFVGRTLILLDRESNLIIDFMKGAVPAT